MSAQPVASSLSCSNAARRSVNGAWNPIATLSIANPDRAGDLTCVGYAPSCGRRCRNPINMYNRSSAWSTIDKLSLLDPAVDDLIPLLRQLAQLTLCLRYHQDQIDSVARKWLAAARATVGHTSDSHVSATLRARAPLVHDSVTDNATSMDVIAMLQEILRQQEVERARRHAAEAAERCARAEVERLRQEAERRDRETVERHERVQAERRERMAAERRERVEAERRERVEAERCKREEVERYEREETERRELEEAARCEREEADRQERLEADQHERLEADQHERMESERRECEETERRERHAKEYTRKAAEQERHRKEQDQLADSMRRRMEALKQEREQPWIDYNEAWKDFDEKKKKGDAAVDDLWWPVESGIFLHVTAEAVSAFYNKALQLEAPEKRRAMMRREAMRWHPDKLSIIKAHGEELAAINLIMGIVSDLWKAVDRSRPRARL